MKLVLIRHGHVDGISPERFRGRLDLPLTEIGLRQAVATRERLRSASAPSTIYTSSMSRCIRTAEIIGEPFGLHPVQLQELNDIDYGEFQGRTFEEVANLWPEQFNMWRSTPHLVTFPAGESLQDVRTRLTAAFRSIIASHNDETVFIVGHSSTNRALLTHLLDLPLSDYWSIKQDPCCINIINCGVTGCCAEILNDTSHLIA